MQAAPGQRVTKWDVVVHVVKAARAALARGRGGRRCRASLGRRGRRRARRGGLGVAVPAELHVDHARHELGALRVVGPLETFQVQAVAYTPASCNTPALLP